MKVAFFGNPEFAVTVVDFLSRHHQIVLVVTNPDRKSGRSLHLRPSAVRQWAIDRQLPVLAPESARGPEVVEAVKASKADVMVVAAYGKILPGALLDCTSHGSVNVHASLLPLYRGAAPIERCLLDGCRETGITIMLMDEGMDTGDILLQGAVEVRGEDDSATLTAKLARLGAKLVVEALDGLPSGTVKPRPQEGEATYADKMAKEELELTWSSSAAAIHNRVRALAPHPGARTTCRGRMVKVLHTRVVALPAPDEPQPGTVITCKHELVVATADGAVELLDVQPENQRVMTGAEFARGARLTEGDLWPI